jgi:RNA polymerase sigma-70 factor (ECF subfamily)
VFLPQSFRYVIPKEAEAATASFPFLSHAREGRSRQAGWDWSRWEIRLTYDFVLSGRRLDPTRSNLHRSVPILSVTVPPEQFETVVAGAKAGAEWAIALLYREFQPGLLRYLRAQAPAHGEDLASEVWLDVAAGVGRFAGDEAAFRRWIFTIARRRLIDSRRREQRRKTVSTSLEPIDPDPGANPETRAVAASETEAALGRIASLPSDQAEVVLLRVVGGLKVEEVAAIVGKKAGAVRVLQHRALKRLAAELVREREEVAVTE